MKKVIINKATVLLFLTTVLMGVSCTKLEPEVKSPNSIAPIDAGGAPAAPTLNVVYNQLNNLSNNQGNWFGMEEHSTDEIIGPTRGTDWDDFGTWRKLHLHTWDAAHNQVNDTWNQLNGALYQTTLLAESTAASEADKNAAKFLRAFFSYLVVDLYGQLQHRPATALVADLPDVYTRSEGIDFVISELETVIPLLPAYTHATRTLATKEAAQFLLAKCYLNKTVYKQDPESPAGPFTFDAADMNKVIALCNAIALNTDLKLANFYWDNFTWKNSVSGSENIFVRSNSDGAGVRWTTNMGWHYNMAPSGWNGFTTLSDFYNSFEDGDMRKTSVIPEYSDKTGNGAGFLVGQIKGPKDGKIGNPIVDLKDRSGNPLIFTPDVSLFFSTETKGIRTNKYPLDPAQINNDNGSASKNDFVFFRFSDVRLMKAEAILRSGTDASETPLAIVNEIRVKRNATPLATLDLTKLLAERGRELYLEGWRRSDMIRFGVFNAPVQERPNPSPPSRVVYPIPNIALSSNPNLHQNAGY